MTQHFSHSRMEYGKDKQGNEILLKDGKFQVMMEWEKPYMQACIDALRPFGDVLEVGFGLGYSADQIQTYHPKSHTIIEFDSVVAARAREWAKKYPNVTIVEDTWQNALAKLGFYDCIFFDDYPLQSEEEMQKMEEEADKSQLLLKKGEIIIKEAEEVLPFLKEIKYSDEDLKGLLRQIKSKEEVDQFARFMTELLGRGQITQEQWQKILQPLVGSEEMARLNLAEKKKTAPDERLFVFLNVCLKSHMRNGSRFSCFLSSAVSKYQDDKFVNEIIANPDLDFHEEEIDIEVPKNCTYFSGNKALVITITKAK